MLFNILLFSLAIFPSQSVTQPVHWPIHKDSAQFINSLNGDNEIERLLKSDKKLSNLPPILSNPSDSERILKPGEIPDYVIDFSPMVHLYSEEKYLPYDISKFVKHFSATFSNGTQVPHGEYPITINKLEDLPRDREVAQVYLTSHTDFDTDPEWITGKYNKPSLSTGEIKDAPAVLIVVDKGNGWVDSYWFYFYSFNLGPFVMGNGPYGNHVGDWEHSLVRFYNGKPVIIWMSAHGGGGAYFFNSLDKSSLGESHPVIFSARGTHANYVSVGQHPHDLPYGILSDFTDRGPLWNPSKNYLAYTLNGSHVTPANGSIAGREMSFGNWLYFSGHWGDAKLPSYDKRQQWSPWEYKYIDGPTGPLFKNLLRISPCERSKWWNVWNGCNVRHYIKYGIGLESEGSNCGNLFDHIKPFWLKKILNQLTWGGWFCYVIDLVLG